MEQKKCPECDKNIIGRADKKFCSDYCRNSYNNKLNQSATNQIRNINNQLKRNWRILEELNPTEKRKIHKNKLEEKGFNFSYFTSIYTTKKNATYFFVYDQGYLALENDYFILVKKK